MAPSPVGHVVRVLGLGAVVALLAVVSACGFDALPTDDTGEGRTDELDEALSGYDLQLPADASEITYTVHTSIDSHAVGVRLRTTTAGLDELLGSIGASKVDLQLGMNPWQDSPRLSSYSPERFDWDLDGITDYAGVEVQSASSSGSTGVLVDVGEPGSPIVYVEALSCC